MMTQPADSTPRPLGELRDSGLLWLINRTTFHPRGFALALVIDPETGNVEGWHLLGDGTEPWAFGDDEDEPFAAAAATLAGKAQRPGG